MIKFIKLFVLLYTIFPYTNVMATETSITQKDIDAAISSATKYLELIDNQKYHEAYTLYINKGLPEEWLKQEKSKFSSNFGKA